MTDKTPQAATARQGAGARRGLFAVGLVLLVPLVAVLVAAFAIVDRDIAAPGWVKARVSERAALMLGGGDLSFGDITVTLGRDLHPRLRLTDVVLRDAAGERIAAVAEIRGLMSPRGLVFERAALMQEVFLSGAQIALRRNIDGSVAVAFERDAASAGLAGSLPELAGLMDAVFERPALAALEQVQIDNVVVNYADARAGQSWTVDGGTAALDLRGGRMQVTGAAFVLSGAGVTGITLAIDSPRGSPQADITIGVTDARAADLATQSAALSWMAALDAPLSAELTTSLDDTGALGPLRVALAIDAGALQPAGQAEPVGFDQIKAVLSYDPDGMRIGFDGIEIASDWGRLSGQGQAFGRDIADGLPGALVGQFRFSDMQINPMGLYPQALPITDLAVDLRLRLDPFRVEIGQAVLSQKDFALALSGHVQAAPGGWEVALDTRLDRIAVADVRALWPEGVKPGTRRWFVNNVQAGRITGLGAGFRLTPDEPARLAAGFGFEDASLTVLRALPPLTGGRGTASLIDNRFVVTVDAATMAAPEGGDLALAGSVLTIEDTRLVPGRPRLDLRAEGTITAALSLLDQPPFAFITKAGRSVSMAEGRARVAGWISWPAVPADQRRPGDLGFDFAADLAQVRSDQIVPDRVLTASRLRVTANTETLEIAGAVQLDGLPATGRWTRGIGAGTDGISAVEAQIELSPRTLEAFDIALPPGSLSGRGSGDLSLLLEAGRPPTFTLSSDLAGVGLTIPQVGWTKAPGARGRLRVAGTLGAPAQIDRLEISGGGLEAAGRIALTAAGQLEAARFDRLRLGNWFDAPLILRGRGAGLPPAVEITGGTVDFRAARFGPPGGDSGPSEIALDRLQLTDGIALTGFRGRFAGAGGLSGQFSGRVNGGPEIRGTVVPQNGRSAIRLRSDDAGGMASAAGLIRNAVGGALDLTLRPASGEGTFDGTLSLRGLRIRDAPTMAALLDAISVVGLLQQMDGQGLAFDDVDATFRLTPRQVIVEKASATGPGLGISVDGIYTLANKELDLQGVISPFYIVNAIGSVLTRRGEGLIGFTYTVRGTADAPQVSVNPLSVLTPGMFREIFRRPAPQVSR